MSPAELKLIDQRRAAAVAAYRKTSSLLAILEHAPLLKADDQRDAVDHLMSAIDLLERAWEKIDHGYSMTLLELAER